MVLLMELMSNLPGTKCLLQFIDLEVSTKVKYIVSRKVISLDEMLIVTPHTISLESSH